MQVLFLIKTITKTHKQSKTKQNNKTPDYYNRRCQKYGPISPKATNSKSFQELLSLVQRWNECAQSSEPWLQRAWGDTGAGVGGMLDLHWAGCVRKEWLFLAPAWPPGEGHAALFSPESASKMQ